MVCVYRTYKMFFRDGDPDEIRAGFYLVKMSFLYESCALPVCFFLWPPLCKLIVDVSH